MLRRLQDVAKLLIFMSNLDHFGTLQNLEDCRMLQSDLYLQVTGNIYGPSRSFRGLPDVAKLLVCIVVGNIRGPPGPFEDCRMSQS